MGGTIHKKLKFTEAQLEKVFTAEKLKNLKNFERYW